MHFYTAALATIGLNTVFAANIQVNYYTDGGCSDYATSIEYSDTWDSGCYNYQWDGSNSANIAGCPSGDPCECYFWPEENCQGQAQGYVTSVPLSINPSATNCASNWGVGWSSMRCDDFA